MLTQLCKIIRSLMYDTPAFGSVSPLYLALTEHCFCQHNYFNHAENYLRCTQFIGFILKHQGN